MVRKRDDGRWEGRIVVGHKKNGDPIHRYVLARTQKELIVKLHDCIEMYRDADLTEDSNMTLGEWLDRWINEYMIFTIRESTLDSYKAMIKNQIKPYLCDRPLSALTTQELQKFYNTVKKKGRVKPDKLHGTELADSMVRGIHMMLHEALDMAVRLRLIVKNPTVGTTIPKSNYPPKQILNDEQLDRFMKRIRQDERWYDFFYTDLTTGLRRGEICGLKWEDFDAENGKLKVRRSVAKRKGGGLNIGETKTETGTRTIVLPPSTAELLRKRKETAVSEWIFPNIYEPEKPMHPDYAYHRLKTLLKQAELPLIRFHDLRHTFATHALAGGVDAKTLSGILGHTNASFTLDTYTHVTTDMQRNASAIVGSFMDEIMLEGDDTNRKKRKNGEGTLRLRKDGRWEGRIVVGYNKKSLPITKCVTAKTKTECSTKLEALKEQYGRSSDKIKPDMTFGDWIDFWYQTYCRHTLRITTRTDYENRIYNHIIPEIGKIPLNRLSQSDLQQFYAKEKTDGRKLHAKTYGKGLSDRTIRGIHANCRTALQRAVQEGLIRTNPAVGCKLPPKKAWEMQVLTQNGIIRFLHQAKEEGCYELFLLELGTGMRRGEILALKWSDLNFQTGELQIVRQACAVNGKIEISVPKTKSSIRTVVLPPSLVEVLKKYRKTVNSWWMFPSPTDTGRPRNPSSVRTRLQLILERAGCKKVRFHDLRHTFATMALENGMDVKTLSATIGHVSAATTLDIYSHMTDTMQMQAAVNIDRKIGGTNAQMPVVVQTTRGNGKTARKRPVCAHRAAS